MLKWVAILGFLLCFTDTLCQVTPDPRCNTDDGTSQCYCKESLVTGRYKIFCQDILDAETLRKSIKVYSGLPIELLELTNASLPYIPEDIFNGLDIHTLDLEELSLNSVFKGNDATNSPLKHLSKTLEFIRVTDTKVKESVNWRLFHGNSVLKTLELSSVTCNGYENWESLDSKQLKNLIIFDGDILILPSKAFSRLINIEDIIINYSKLTKITRDVFPIPANKLKLIELSENEIDNLPEDLFTQMPNLKIVTLDRNRLKTVSEVTMAPVLGQLRGLAISGNPFTCDKKLFWILNANISNIKSDVNKITCDNPTSLHKRKLQSLTENDLHE